jgi:myo-inositol-1(or 4)-monophosphatase
MGLEIEGSLEWGIVYNPNLEEAFTARRAGGAYLNGVPIRVSETETLVASLLATGFPYDIRTSASNNLDYFRAFALRAQGIRRAGSAALDLCYVAAGRFDGFWELKLNPWDCAAGYLMVREAGGKVTNWRGEEGSIYDRECLATNSRIHGQMMTVLHQTTAAKPEQD